MQGLGVLLNFVLQFLKLTRGLDGLPAPIVQDHIVVVDLVIHAAVLFVDHHLELCELVVGKGEV